MSGGELFVEGALFGMAVRWGAGRLVTWECLVGWDRMEIERVMFERARRGEPIQRSQVGSGVGRESNEQSVNWGVGRWSWTLG
jgi:hypothetical protein